MKKILILLVMLLSFAVVNAQKQYTREGNNFTSVSSRGGSKAEPTKTKFTWTDSKGNQYPIYMSASGSCFVIKVSKNTGKEYRNYLGPEISAQICKEMGVEYKGKSKNVNK